MAVTAAVQVNAHQSWLSIYSCYYSFQNSKSEAIKIVQNVESSIFASFLVTDLHFSLRSSMCFRKSMPSENLVAHSHFSALIVAISEKML